MTTAEAVGREVADLDRNIKTNGLFKGEVDVTKPYDQSGGTFEVTISPNGGNHAKGEYTFKIVMGCDSPLRINCYTAIYHPNIDMATGSCNGKVLKQDCSVQDVVTRLLDLMHNPDFVNSPMKIEATSKQHVEEFWSDTVTSIAGGRVGDYLFPVNARYAKSHPANDEGENTEVEGMVLKDENFGIKRYILRSTLDEDDDEGNGDGDEDGDDDDDDDEENNSEEDDEG